MPNFIKCGLRIASCVLIAFCAVHSASSQTVLGKSPYDRVIPGFWGMGTNADALVAGLNGASGTIKVTNFAAVFGFLPSTNATPNLNGFATNLTASGTFSGDGSGLAAVTATNLTGTFNISDVPVTATAGWLDFTAFSNGLKANNFQGSGADLLHLQATNIDTGSGPLPSSVLTAGTTNTAGHLLVLGVVGGVTNRYTTFNGSSLTGFTSNQIPGLNATNINSGTLASALLTNSSFASTMAPTFSGANLTLLNASAISGGTLADARLSTNVPLLNGTLQRWNPAGTNIFGGVVVSNGGFTVYGGTNYFTTNAAQTNVVLAFPPGNAAVVGANASFILGDYNRFWFSSDASTAGMGYFPNHTGSQGEWGVNAPRLTIAPGFAVPGGQGSLQFGWGSAVAGTNSLNVQYYVNPSKVPYSLADPFGYGCVWLFRGGGGYNGTGVVPADMAFRVGTADTNGTGSFDLFAPTYLQNPDNANGSGLGGPSYNEVPGVFAANFRAGTNANSTGVSLHGSVTYDTTVVVPAGTNYTVNFEGTQELEVYPNNNLNLTAGTIVFGRTNQVVKTKLNIWPGLANYMLTVPPVSSNWVYNTNTFTTNIAGSQVMTLELSAIVANGSTNIYATQITNNNYTPVTDPLAASYFSQTGLTSAQDKNAINQFLVSERNAGRVSTNKMIACWFMPASGNAATNTVGLTSSNTFLNATVHGTLTNNANGVSTDGSTGYWDLGFKPSQVFQSQNSACLVVYTKPGTNFSTLNYSAFVAVQDNSFLNCSIGAYGATSCGATAIGLNGTGSDGMTVGTALPGVIAANRTAAASMTIYGGGQSQTYTDTSASGLGNNYNFYAFARNNTGSPDRFAPQGCVISFIGLYQNMSASDMTGLMSDLAAYQAAEGRQ